MTFLETLELLLSHPTSLVLLAIILAVEAWSTRITWRNSQKIDKISYVLFGTEEEQEMNGTGVYQEVKEMKKQMKKWE